MCADRLSVRAIDVLSEREKKSKEHVQYATGLGAMQNGTHGKLQVKQPVSGGI